MAINKKRADSIVNIRPEEFVVTVRGNRAEFAKLARKLKSPPVMKPGDFDVFAYLRAARDGDCKY